MPPGRIAIVATKMDEGGTIRVALQLAAGLRDRGHEVESWFLYVSRAIPLDPSGVRVMLPGVPSGPLDLPGIIRPVAAALRSFRPHAVHAIMPLANVIGLGAARAFGCPARVASQHQPASTLKPVMRLLDRAAGSAGVYTANVSVSESVRASFAGHPKAYRDRIQVIPNGVAEPVSPLSPQAARAAFGFPEAAPLLGTIGRLVAEKNQGFLLDVLAAVPQAHLAVGGGGELENDLRLKAVELGLGGRVHMVGHLAPDRIADLLRALDIFLFPSISEGMPIALLEAMAAGLPIIASDIAANREVAAGGVTILGTASPESWAAKVRQLLDSAEMREALGAAGRDRAKAFSNDAMIDRYEKLLLGPARSG
jgi:glycosyltransferase involved in cell wall biosynthesis